MNTTCSRTITLMSFEVCFGIAFLSLGKHYAGEVFNPDVHSDNDNALFNVMNDRIQGLKCFAQ